jgi:hypothetical protein
MTLDINWKDIDYQLQPELSQILNETLGFTNVMPVQKAVIPIFSKNYDVAVEVSQSPIIFNSSRLPPDQARPSLFFCQ